MTISNSSCSPIRGNGTDSGAGAISRSASAVLPGTFLRKPAIQVDRPRSLDQDPPDCEATLDGQFSGIEVTELVHQATLERSIKAVRQRSRGEEPQKPEAYFDWDRDDLIAALENILLLKNSAKPRLSYERYVLVIHTGEYLLDSDRVKRLLKGATFSTSLITHAFLGLSYEPGK